MRRQQRNDLLDGFIADLGVQALFVGTAIEVGCRSGVEAPEILGFPRRQRIRIHRLDVGQRHQGEHLQPLGRADLFRPVRGWPPDRRYRGDAEWKKSPDGGNQEADRLGIFFGKLHAFHGRCASCRLLCT